MGEEMSHSAVIRHISKFVKPENIKQIGIRSGMKEEWDFMEKYNTLCHNYSDLDSLKGKNVFVTVDLDCLDTSIMSGTGTPEAGGMTFNELVGWFKYLKDFNIVGADVVELAPDYDASGVSTAVATKVIRELLMAMSQFYSSSCYRRNLSEEFMQIEERIQYLKDEINKSNYRYYVEENPYLSDFDYDKLFAELKELEELERKEGKAHINDD